ncbi:MAG: glucose-6-phosphate isomerase, partial [Xanthomonadales bacterium]|nr:glucose-6-phosphate isomerase [Xanthomonadales bacterium]
MSASASGFDALKSHAQRLQGTRIAGLLQSEPGRVAGHALQVGPLYANFARQRYDDAAWAALLGLGRQRDLAGAFRRLFDGEKVNVTEGRAALHTALRGDLSPAPAAREAHRVAVE